MAEKGSKKKPVAKKSKMKWLASKRFKDPAKLRKRPKWITPKAWRKALAPPQGVGHIDRFYFSTFLAHGQVSPMTNGLVRMMPTTFETIKVGISVIVQAGGTNYQCDYLCEIPASYGEFINCIVVGIAKYVRGTSWQNELFGEIFGSLGTTYHLEPANMVII